MYNKGECENNVLPNTWHQWRDINYEKKAKRHPKLKSTITGMTNPWEGLTRFEQAKNKESSILKRNRLRNRKKKNEEKWADPHKSVGQLQGDQSIYSESSKRRGVKVLERILEERKVKNLLNLMENVRPLNQESKNCQVGSTQRDLTPRYIIIKTVLRAARSKRFSRYKGSSKRSLSNSSAELAENSLQQKTQTFKEWKSVNQ